MINESLGLYYSTKHANQPHTPASRTRFHTSNTSCQKKNKQETLTTLANSQNSHRKSSNYQRSAFNKSISLHSDTDEGGTIKRMNCYQSINNKMEKFTQCKKKLQNINFFEGAFLIGSQNSKTSILYKYGNNQHNQFYQQLSDMLCELLFPFGTNDVQKSLSDSNSEMNSILYKRHVSEDNEDCFIVPLKTNQSFEKKLALIHENKNQLAFCICVRIKDIQHNKLGYKVYDRILCIVSYLPLFKYFTDFLISVINCAKEERLKGIPFAQYIQNCNLFDTLPIQVPSQQISPIYYEYNNIYCKKLKFLQNAIFTAQIAINIILEQSVIFLGENIEQLSASLMLFLRNMIWMHQLVACIPPNKLDILNMPVPLLGGIAIEDEEEGKELYQEYSNIIFVDIVRQKIYNSKDFSKSFLFLQLIKHLNGKFYEQIGEVLEECQQDTVKIAKEDPLQAFCTQTQYYVERLQQNSNKFLNFKR